MTKLYRNEVVYHADCNFNLAHCHYLNNNSRASLEAYEKALEIYIKIYGKHDCRVSNLYTKMAKVYFDQEQVTKAWEVYVKSLEMFHDFVGLFHLEVNSKNP